MLTEEEIIEIMMKADAGTPTLAYDAGQGGIYLVCGHGEVEEAVVDSLLQKGLIQYGDVIHGGSVQLYELRLW